MKRYAILADSHLSAYIDSVQYDVFNWAVDEMKKMQLDGVIVAGDITALGEAEAIDYFKAKMDEIDAEKVVLLGNSDVRTKDTVSYISNFACGDGFEAENRQINCINTP